MYLRAVHAESHLPTRRQLIKDYPLGNLTTAIASSAYPFLQTSHIPWVLDVQDDASETELGVLRGHMARQNPQAKAMIDFKDEVLVLFTGTSHHYVTPKFYTETKPATGKVVPTWNYAAVPAYGKATVYFDTGVESTEFLSRQIDALSRHAETSIMGYTKPWAVSDAPERYISLMQKAIIGIKINITRLEGKFKMSQELGQGDRDGVIRGFQSLGTDVGTEVSRCVSERQELAKKNKSQS
ncbi:putative FMN-binding domain-containing protein [Aspergillus bertholletiae]|uniref:Putative FMN-binding domain-containing protein n=1 Tax=Aspergillus bertholletiae TaxID=1226010 RepID=A0A5N7BE68_9EURO|nr:putative FMN-binding domain-containing protein [Aspergillus bertholletiae]